MMKSLSNEYYYNILLEACKEAFYNFETKEFLSTPEGVTYNDENAKITLSNETIQRWGQKLSLKTIVDHNLQDMVDRSFLDYLERQRIIFKEKYRIERHDFYKRCLTVLNIKQLEYYKNNSRKPQRNLSDMGDNPDSFEYLESIKYHLEQRAKKPVLIQVPKESEVIIFDKEQSLNAEKETNVQLSEQKNIKPKKAPKTLFDFIANVKDKEAFAKDMKDTFNTESGIDFKIIIELLKVENMLLIGNRDFAGFYRVTEPYFNRNIGTQNGLNDLYKHTADEQTIYFDKIQIIKVKLNPLIKNHKALE